MSQNHFYVTTTLPYVNADPHIGFALEIVEADVIARYQRLLGKEVIFNTGTDEHGQKIYQQAQAQDQSPQKYCDLYAKKFAQLKPLLNLSYDHFIRTTNPEHMAAAQHFWTLAAKKGDIYQADYPVKYCVGCELEKTDSELENGRCPLHPDQDLEIRQEQNYFFRFSRYQQPLLDFYQKHPNFVKPEGKMKEIVAFVKNGLKDFSISRLKAKMPWGVPVPGDPEHVMYVWFDALVNYISTLGWPQNKGQNKTDFEFYWPGVQLAGKDNLRQQAAMWQSMLMSAGLPNSKQILINGFINVEGQKMSKSLGNVISPEEMVKRYQTEPTRLLLVALDGFGPDMDVSFDKFNQTYTAHLANGLGNLCSRVAKLAAMAELRYTAPQAQTAAADYQAVMDQFELAQGLDWVLGQIKQADQYLSHTQPWEKSGAEQARILNKAIEKIQQIAYHLQPFMPETAQAISNHFQDEIKPLKPMFPRLK